ncbi:amidase signature enzyme [Cadophora sp. DSE1049]|nr:amidase signature enzyme [Cadophora sp. DSE1049]
MREIGTTTAPGTVVELQDRRYLLRPRLLMIADDGIKPILVLSVNSDNCSAESIVEKVKSFDESDDDVFCADFLSDTLILQSQSIQAQELLDIKTKLQGLEILGMNAWELKSLFLLPPSSEATQLPCGPYFLHNNQIYEAWKLYDDKLSAFQTCVVPDEDDPYRFHVLDTLSTDGYWKIVAVPSRLYTPVTRERPLAGVRVAVKDVYRLTGVKASLNVRSFLETYGPDVEIAAYVKKLIDLGAVIVGKTKTAAFAGSEKAPEYWIDFQCPFNPRADGYQVPSGSTSGGGAGLAGYEWLDFSLGTDTYGSIRAPAASNGLYGLRCTVNEVASMENIYPQCKEFDTMGFLSRDLADFHNLGRLSFNKTLMHDEKFPTRIICPTDWSSKWTDFHHKVMDKAVSALEDFLGIKREVFSFSDVWKQCPPPEADGKSFQEFFRMTGYNIFYHDAYHQWGQFRQDHMDKFGTPEVVGPHTRFCWNLGAKITTEERNKSLRELQIYREWMTKHFLPPDPEDSGVGSTIIIIPQGSTVPDYRDEMTEGMNARFGPDPNSWGAWLGIPQLVLPVDNCPYLSRITGRTESLPTSVSLLGTKGSDLMLIKLALLAFEQAGLPTTLQTGRSIL